MSLNYLQWSTELGHFVRVTPEVKVDITRSCSHPKKQYDFGTPKQKPVRQARKSEYTGVTFRERCERPWQARIRVDGICVTIGYYYSERDAALAYDREAIKLGRPTNILKKAS